MLYQTSGWRTTQPVQCRPGLRESLPGHVCNAKFLSRDHVSRARDRDESLLTFYAFPAEHWILTSGRTNPVEYDMARTVRLRIPKKTKGGGQPGGVLPAMVFE